MSKNLIPNHLSKSLKDREQKGLMRKLKTKFPKIDFCSNDYLGFSKSKAKLETSASTPFENLSVRSASNSEIRNQKFPIGSTGSRLITGNSEFTEKVEIQIAKFHHAESALIFNSGYDANVGLFSSVPQKNDLILFDEFIHASIYDGIRLSYANHFKFEHNNIQELEKLIQRHKEKHNNIFIAVESVYSMDGDCAPLKELVVLCEKNKNVFLIVDEAHAIGVFGKEGRGLCNELKIENKCFARIYTYGKALGCHGAAIVGDKVLRDYLINFARSFIYTTALPPHSIEIISNAYKLLTKSKNQKLLQENIKYFNYKTSKIKNIIQSNSAIQCLVVGNNEKAEGLEKLLAKSKFSSKAIKSPTVKAGSERIRFCLHSYNTKKEIDNLTNILKLFK